MNDIYNEYKKANISTASPGILILLGFENIENAIKNSMLYCDRHDYFNMNSELIRAQKILNEFIIALDFKVAEVAVNLYRIYNSWVKKLIQSNIEKDTKKMDNVLDEAMILHNSWKEVVKKVDTSTKVVRHQGINLTG